jgi:hypothetical protein
MWSAVVNCHWVTQVWSFDSTRFQLVPPTTISSTPLAGISRRQAGDGRLAIIEWLVSDPDTPLTGFTLTWAVGCGHAENFYP